MKKILLLLLALAAMEAIGQTTTGNLVVKMNDESQNPFILDSAVWNDLSFPATRLRQGATQKPDFDSDNIGLLFPDNDTSERVFIVAQVLHDWKLGTDLSPHVHWIQTTSDSAIFVIKYRIYEIGELVPDVWQFDTLASGVIPYISGDLHQLSNGVEVDMSDNASESVNIDIMLYRSPDDLISGDVLVKYFDFHYQVNRLGNVADY